MFFVGVILHRQGTAVRDARKQARDKDAYKKYRLAAARGDTRAAQFCLGVMFGDSSWGVPGDEEQIASAVLNLAERGDAKAQTIMGVLCGNAQGTMQGDAQAVEWFRLAAEQGDPWAQFKLGRSYETGRGIPVDRIEAHKWLSLGTPKLRDELWEANEDFEDATDAVEAKMSPAEVAEAEKRAREWTEAFAKRKK